jgi:hypothetical protein
MISCGDELREHGPVAERLRVRTIRSIFGNHLLLVCECPARGDQFFCSLLIFLGAIGSWAEQARQPTVLVSFRHRERSYVAPLRAYEWLRHKVGGGTDVGERLPVVWIRWRGAYRDSSREDLERGTPQEIAKAKVAFISKNGYSGWETLPQTKKQADRQNPPVNPSMIRAEWLALPFSERSRLTAVSDKETLGKIISRKG